MARFGTKKIIAVIIALVLVGAIAVTAVIVTQLPRGGTSTGGGGGGGNTGTATSTVTIPGSILHAQGSQLINGNGHPFLLHGAQIESPLNYIKRWDSGEDPMNFLNSKVFTAMVQDWKMNALRVPISNWIYAKDPTKYLNILDQVVQQANAAGLYIILDLHDDDKSGSPYGKGTSIPKTENIPFWKAIASHYKDNSMMIFDVFNEPMYHSWDMWLHGGGTVNGATVIGYQDLVDAVRSTGAKQPIVVEPGGGGKTGWASIGSHLINDPNIIYSLHVYDGIMQSAQEQDARWGPLLNHYPIYYGEWAFLPNAYGASHCQGIAHDQADQVVTAFLNYMDSRHANWTAWEFTPRHLVENYTSFAPTTLDTSWTCGDPTADAGMGILVKAYLMSHSS